VLADKLKCLRYDLRKWHVSLSKLKGLIENCNKVILLLDELEEKRSLYRTEFNFRRIVKLHLEGLILAECKYWRKRCTIRRIKQGEDNKKKFTLWLLRDIIEILLPCCRIPMGMRSLIIKRWLVCFGHIIKREWGDLMVFECSLI
jgi:hypothetical protein